MNASEHIVLFLHYCRIYSPHRILASWRILGKHRPEPSPRQAVSGDMLRGFGMIGLEYVWEVCGWYLDMCLAHVEK